MANKFHPPPPNPLYSSPNQLNPLKIPPTPPGIKKKMFIRASVNCHFPIALQGVIQAKLANLKENRNHVMKMLNENEEGHQKNKITHRSRTKICGIDHNKIKTAT